MLDLKRKIKPFLPGEATRGALQNVLTVEWSGHKTVLVEVPSGPSRSNEVELSPLRDDSRGGAGSNGYGRLDDEDSDDSYRRTGYFDQPRSSRERKSSLAKSHRGTGTGSGSGSAPPLPSRPSRPQPQFNRPELGLNPFDANSTYSRSNLFTQSQSSSSHRSGVSPSFMESDFDLDQNPDHDDTHRRRPHHAPPIPDRPQHSARSRPAEGWTTFESPLTTQQHGAFPTTPAYPAHPSYSRGAGGKYDAWSKGGWSQTTSPTSSTGTRNSGQMSLDDDPFREPEA